MSCQECYDRLVGVAEVAAMAKVTRAAVTQWHKRHADFPRPVAVLAMGPMWDREQIAAWLLPRVIERPVSGHRRGPVKVKGYSTTRTVVRGG